MFILYGYVANSWKKIDIAVNESEIVDTMIVCSDKYHLYDFRIEQTGKKKKERYIRGREELAGYLHEYKTKLQKLEDMSCVELKRYILNKKSSR